MFHYILTGKTNPTSVSFKPFLSKENQLPNTLNTDPRPNSSHSPSNSPSLRCPNEELTEKPALFILIVPDGIVELMAHSNLHIGKEKKRTRKVSEKSVQIYGLSLIRKYPLKASREEKGRTPKLPSGNPSLKYADSISLYLK